MFNYFRMTFAFLFWFGTSLLILIALYNAWDYIRSERLIEEEMYKVAAKEDCEYLGRPWGTHNLALFSCGGKVMADIYNPERPQEVYPNGYKKERK